MWLLPAWSALSRFGARTYYRLTRAGADVPASGPVLLVANHPNSLLDPALVVAAAGRPVRFLAGSRTVAHPQIGWMIRGVGSIPVYRRIDDPSQVGKNEEMFLAATAALAEGSAIGIFPEGISLDDPHLQPLKTGAARLALSAVNECGAVPIIPVGLVYRDRDRFRSEALVIVGRAIPWEDLAYAGAASGEPVRELTRRIESALRDVTVNLERWEDAPVIEGAEAIWAAELRAPDDPAARVERLRLATETLAYIRREESDRWRTLERDVSRHVRTLALLGLEPADLHDTATDAAALRWTLRRLPTLLLGALVLTTGVALFALPYRLSAMIGAHTAPREAARSTHTVLYGTVVFVLWIVLLSVVAGGFGGWLAAAIALAVLPVWALASAGARDRWRAAWRDVRRFLTLRRRAAVLRDLATEQHALGGELARIVETLAPRAMTTSRPGPASLAREV